MRLFGLIGFPLSHSFSKGYFTKKFSTENILDAQYELYELEDISNFPELISTKENLLGLNVTIPHKQAVIPFLDSLDISAKEVGAVNVIKFIDGKKIGYNSDYYGFKKSLEKFISSNFSSKALVLGSGGAAKAVVAALNSLGIDYKYVSRTKSETSFDYDSLTEEIINEYKLIINTSPIGMYPMVDNCPKLPYEAIGSEHYLFDLVYNPTETLFMKKGLERGAKVINGLEMLHLQAEKAWEIWNTIESTEK